MEYVFKSIHQTLGKIKGFPFNCALERTLIEKSLLSSQTLLKYEWFGIHANSVQRVLSPLNAYLKVA